MDLTPWVGALHTLPPVLSAARPMSQLQATPAAVAPSVPSRPTLRSLWAGMLLAALLCFINSYLTLSFGVIEEGPTIAALFFFAACALLGSKVTPPEMVMVATMGSAGGSLGFITNFYAAKAMTGTPYVLWEMALFGTVTSLLGLMFVVPLRQMLVLGEDLPWPSSRAVASVIRSLTSATADKRQPLILLGSTVFFIAYVVLNDEDGFGIVPSGIALPIFGLGVFGLGVALSPFATIGSYLLGLRTCVGFLAGAVCLLVMAPYVPEPAAPHHYVWPGIGFLLAGGMALMALNWKVLVASLKGLVKLRGVEVDPNDVVVSPRAYAGLAAAALLFTTVFSLWVLDLNVVVVVMLVVVAGFIQNVIATRAAAQTAFNPARVMGVLLEGICAALGARTAGQNLAGAGFVAGSGAQAGNLTGDMVYGRWLGVPPRWQFWGQAMTIIPCAIISAFVFTYIQEATPLTLEGPGLPAPVAKIWAASALVFEGQRQMPPGALLHGLLAGLCAIVYVVLEEKTPLGKYLPSSTGLGIGLVLPISVDLAFFTGGFVMWVVLGRGLKVSADTLTSVAVAGIVGEGLGGVIKPLLARVGVLGH